MPRQRIFAHMLSRFFALSVCVLVAAAVCASPASARTIRLGGDTKTKDTSFMIIELPSINVAMPKGDDYGGWRHIRIDAYILPRDPETGAMLDGVKSSIVKHAVEETVPNTGFDKLNTPYGGEEAAKKAVRTAAQMALGHDFDGEVMVKTFLSY